MPVSLGRRIRRIGIPPKGQRLDNWKADQTSIAFVDEATRIITDAKQRRKKARTLQQLPSKQNRRSKARIKRTVKMEVSRGKK